MKIKSNTVKNVIFPLIALAVIILVWKIGALIYDVELILPPPEEAFTQFIQLLFQRQFWSALTFSLIRSLMSFSLSFITALILAILGYFFKTFYRFLSPIITILRSIPTMSIILLFIIWSTPGVTPILVAYLVIMPLLFSSFTAALERIDIELIETGKVFGLNKIYLTFSVLLPCIFSYILEAAASSLSLTVKLIIAAEVLAQTAKSLGFEMQISKLYLETARLMALTVVTVIICIVFEFIIRSVKRIYDKKINF